MEIDTSTPMINDIGILALVPDTWGDGVWQVRQQILTRLSQYFNVIWSDPPVGWRKSVRSGLHKPVFYAPSKKDAPGLEVHRHSMWAAKFYNPHWIAGVTDGVRVREGIRQLKKRGCNICIGYLWRPEYANSLWAGRFDKRCYHIDDEYSFSVVDQPIDEYEQQIITRVDQVFIHSPALMEKKGGLNPNSICVPNGVDFDSYIRSYEIPHDLVEIDGPIVEYIGVLKSQIDWELILTIALRLPQLSFVFIGPEGHLESADKKALNTLRGLKNTFFLGIKNVDTLAAYAAHADVCIMPYKMDGYTRYIFPIKVNEYLAAGKPTIGTPIRSLQEYAKVVDLAVSPAEWCEALQRNVRPECRSPEAVDARRAVAMNYDWKILVGRIAKSICSMAGNRYVKQLEGMNSK